MARSKSTTETVEGFVFRLPERQEAIDQADAVIATRSADAEQARLIHDTAESMLDDLILKLRAGDQSIDALALATSEAAVRRAEYLLTGAEHAVTTAKRAKPHLPDTALALADVLRGILGVECRVVTRPPKAEDLIDAELPTLFLLENTPGKRDPHTGSLSGRIGAWWVHGPLHVDMNTEQVQEALKERGVTAHVDGVGRDRKGEYLLSRVSFDVRQIHDARPRIDGEIQGFRVGRFGPVLAARLRDWLTIGGKVREDVEVTVDGFESELDGTDRNTTVKLGVKFSNSVFASSAILGHLEIVVASLTGRVIPGVGRIQSRAILHSAHDGAQVEFVFASRTA